MAREVGLMLRVVEQAGGRFQLAPVLPVIDQDGVRLARHLNDKPNVTGQIPILVIRARDRRRSTQSDDGPFLLQSLDQLSQIDLEPLHARLAGN